MKKKIFLGFGIFFLVSMVIGLSSAAYYYHVNSPQMYYNVEPNHAPQNLAPYSSESRPVATPYSRPGYQFLGPIDVRHKYIVPRVEMVEPQFSPMEMEPMRNENVMPDINGKILEARIGDEIQFSVDLDSFGRDDRVKWKWHYNSHAIHCNETNDGVLICKEINPHIASEVWAEFFVPQDYELTYASNVIEPKEENIMVEDIMMEDTVDTMEENVVVQNILVEAEINVQENFYMEMPSQGCFEADPYDNRCDLY